MFFTIPNGATFAGASVKSDAKTSSAAPNQQTTSSTSASSTTSSNVQSVVLPTLTAGPAFTPNSTLSNVEIVYPTIGSVEVEDGIFTIPKNSINSISTSSTPATTPFLEDNLGLFAESQSGSQTTSNSIFSGTYAIMPSTTPTPTPSTQVEKGKIDVVETPVGSNEPKDPIAEDVARLIETNVDRLRNATIGKSVFKIFKFIKGYFAARALDQKTYGKEGLKTIKALKKAAAKVAHTTCIRHFTKEERKNSENDLSSGIAYGQRKEEKVLERKRNAITAELEFYEVFAKRVQQVTSASENSISYGENLVKYSEAAVAILKTATLKEQEKTRKAGYPEKASLITFPGEKHVIAEDIVKMTSVVDNFETRVSNTYHMIVDNQEEIFEDLEEIRQSLVEEKEAISQNLVEDKETIRRQTLTMYVNDFARQSLDKITPKAFEGAVKLFSKLTGYDAALIQLILRDAIIKTHGESLKAEVEAYMDPALINPKLDIFTGPITLPMKQKLAEIEIQIQAANTAEEAARKKCQEVEKDLAAMKTAYNQVCDAAIKEYQEANPGKSITKDVIVDIVSDNSNIVQKRNAVRILTADFAKAEQTYSTKIDESSALEKAKAVLETQIAQVNASTEVRRKAVAYATFYNELNIEVAEGDEEERSAALNAAIANTLNA